MPSRLAYVAAEMYGSGESWRGRAAFLPHFHCSYLSFVDFAFFKTTFSSAWIYGCRVFTLLFCFRHVHETRANIPALSASPGACPELGTQAGWWPWEPRRCPPRATLCHPVPTPCPPVPPRCCGQARAAPLPPCFLGSRSPVPLLGTLEAGTSPSVPTPAQSPFAPLLLGSCRSPRSLSSGHLMNRLLDFFPFQAMNKT